MSLFLLAVDGGSGTALKPRAPKGGTDRRRWDRATGVTAMGARRTTEFPMAIESILDCLGLCGEGRVGPFIPPTRDLGSNWATHLGPVFSSNSPRSLPTCPSSPGKPSRSCLSKFTTEIPEVYRFPPHSCVHPFRRGVLPGPRGSCYPPLRLEKVCFPWNLSRPDTYSTPPFHPTQISSITRTLGNSRFTSQCQKYYIPSLSSPAPRPQNSFVTLSLFLARR